MFSLELYPFFLILSLNCFVYKYHLNIPVTDDNDIYLLPSLPTFILLGHYLAGYGGDGLFVYFEAVCFSHLYIFFDDFFLIIIIIYINKN